VRKRENPSSTGALLLLGLAGFVGLGWAVGELWLSVVGSLEADYMRTLAGERSAPLIEVARIVTWAGSTWLLVPLALLCCVLLGRAGRRLDALTVTLSLGGVFAIDSAVKALVARPRPGIEHLQHVSGWSFPSAHTGQAAAFWTSLLLVLPGASRGRPASWIAACGAAAIVLVVAWSRVYLGVHFPSDVIAGALIGSGWALFTRVVLTR
jgi:undecaprenyl-diphosphatase